MNESTQTAPEAPEAAPETAETAYPKGVALVASDIGKLYFKAGEVDTEAVQAVINLADLQNLPTITNYDITGALPDGCDLVVRALTEGKGKGEKLKTIGVMIGAVPSFEAMQADKLGLEYIAEKATDGVIAKLNNACRTHVNGSDTKRILPVSMSDFVTSLRAESELKTFKAMTKAIVANLSKRNINGVTAGNVRSILSNQAIASVLIPKAPAAFWDAFLDFVSAEASKENLDPAIFQTWKAERNVAPEEVESDIEIDLSFG
jgi:hypothetical protein